MQSQRPQTEIHTDIINMIERPRDRAEVPEQEARTLEFLEDPVDFAQMMHLLLGGSSILSDLLAPPAPKYMRDAEQAMKDVLHEAIRRRADHEVLREIAIRVDDLSTSAMSDAVEYGVAQGAVLEQFRQGLIRIAALRYAGRSYGVQRSLDDVQEARDLLEGRRTPGQSIDTPPAVQEGAA